MLAVVVNANLAAAAAGGAALAAYAVCARLQVFAGMPQVGISQGLQPMPGYNFGSGNLARTLRTRRLGLFATLGYGILAAVVLSLAADPLVRLFVDDPATTTLAANALRILSVGIAAAGVAPLLAGYYQAIGRATPSYLISIGTVVVITLPRAGGQRPLGRGDLGRPQRRRVPGGAGRAGALTVSAHGLRNCVERRQMSRFTKRNFELYDAELRAGQPCARTLRCT